MRLSANEKPTQVETPLLGGYKKTNITSKNVFRVTREDLQLFFEKKNIRKPDNVGECRDSLNILKEFNYS